MNTFTFHPQLSTTDIQAILSREDADQFFGPRAKQVIAYSDMLLRSNGCAVTVPAILAVADDPALAALLRPSAKMTPEVSRLVVFGEPDEQRRGVLGTVEEYLDAAVASLVR